MSVRQFMNTARGKHGHAVFVATLSLIVSLSDARAQVERVSSSTNNVEADGMTEESAVITPNGRYVAFCSTATNLVVGDTNGKQDCFRADLQNGTILRVSITSTGGQPDEDCSTPSISDDGQLVVFQSAATNMTENEDGTLNDIFLRDISAGTLVRVSRQSGGANPSNESTLPAISGDGKYVAFFSAADDIEGRVAGGCYFQAFRYSVQAGTTSQVSVDNVNAAFTCSGGAAPNGVDISADGAVVAFSAQYTSLSGNGSAQIFTRNYDTSTTTMESVSNGGVQGNRQSFGPKLSSNGRYLAFNSDSSNLTVDDVNRKADVFLRDRMGGTTVIVSRADADTPSNGDSWFPRISSDGRFVSFVSYAGNLIATEPKLPADPNSSSPFLVDTATGTVMRIAMGTSGGLPNDSSGFAVPSSLGQKLVFTSFAANLMSSPTSGSQQLYVLSDQCINDSSKLRPGSCGCGVSEEDGDDDGTPACLDACDSDESKTSPGICGCGVPDEDTTGSGVFDCQNPGFQTVPAAAEVGRIAGKPQSRRVTFEKFGLGVTYFYRVTNGDRLVQAGSTNRSQLTLKNLPKGKFSVRYYAEWSGRRTKWSEFRSITVSSVSRTTKAKRHHLKRRGIAKFA